MKIIGWLFGNWQLALALTGALAIGGAGLSWYIHHLHGQIVERDEKIGSLKSDLKVAVDANRQTLAAFETYKNDTKAAMAASAAALQEAQDRSAAVTQIRREVSRVAQTHPGPAPAVGPYTTLAIERLRQLRARGRDQTPSGAGAGASGAAPVRAGP